MYNADEILQIAVTIEENAKAFYTQAAESVSDEGAKRIFAELAAWETSHIELFSKMRKRFLESNQDITYEDPDGEAAKYLQAIGDGKIFDIRKKDAELAALPDDPIAILETAIGKEKDAVIFYLSFMDVVPESLGKADVKKILEEEMGHVRYLSEKVAELRG